MDLAFLGIHKELGFDLGSSRTVISVKGKGTLPSEPTVVAMDTLTKKVMSVGKAADEMLGRTPDNIKALCPVREGVIADFEPTVGLIHAFFKKALGRSLMFKPHVAVSVPISITEVERRATIEAFQSAGAGNVVLIEACVASAIGAGIDISKPQGCMVVDLGAGKSEAAVLSLGGIVSAKSIRRGGDSMNDLIVMYMRRKYQATIGEKTAEEIKTEIGSATEALSEGTYDVKGRETSTGLPKNIRVSAAEIQKVIEPVVKDILEAILDTLENTPPELAADVLASGITLTGAGANLKGIREIIESVTGIKTKVAANAEECTAIGALEAMSKTDIITRSFVAKSR
ncbi:MAG: rod shape-determining protein [Clostridia bacterium]|nr:rod shape-determining protein [Clostridia bacterium]